MVEKIGTQSNNFLKVWWHKRQARIEALAEAIPQDDGPFFTGRLPFVLLLTLASIGTFAAAFLSYRHILLESQSGGVGESILCKAHGNINCDAILLTDYSVLFGYFPSAFLGLIGFVLVLWCVCNGIINERMRKMAVSVLLMYFCAAMVFSSYYVYVMIYKVDYICTWCLVVHAVNLMSLIIVLTVSIRNRKKFLLREISTVFERFYWLAAGLLLCAFVFIGATAWEKSLSFHSVKLKYESLANDPLVILAILRGSERYEIPIGAEDPVYGRTDARFPIIIFSDFQCPVCAGTKAFLRRLVDLNPGELKLVYKNYPLCTKCNPTILANLHPAACSMARAAYAAFLIGGNKAFWSYGDLLFKHQKSLKPSDLTAFAQRLRLDEKKFAALIGPDSPVDKKIAEDVKWGTKLSLDGTPAIVFQGKKIPENLKGKFLVDTMEGLIRNDHPELADVALKWR